MIVISKSIFGYIDKKGKEHETYHMGSTESLRELHQFAQSIGLRPEWFQDKLIPHYDIFGGMIERAREAGATTLKSSEFLRQVHRTARETVSYGVYGENWTGHIVTKET
ncbi:MAG: DUF4031 domain-containing protein [Clostridia bacterium]|jgi:hypothetical protein